MLSIAALQQTPRSAGAQFDVVSIKPSRNSTTAGDMRTLPDGTFRMIALPISSILMSAAPEPVREVSGAPEWAKTERYDIIAKPAPGPVPTREQQVEMLRHMLIDRMKISGHVEEVERSAFALVVARRDRRLGPGLKKSTIGCPLPTPPNRHYGQARLSADPSAPPSSGDTPQFFTALQEQLGLKLVAERIKVKAFVVDRIERPTPD